MNLFLPEIVLVVDCESIGLYGETYAVACAVYDMTDSRGPKKLSIDGLWACPPGLAKGDEDDRKWCAENIPDIRVGLLDSTPKSVRSVFSEFWKCAKKQWPSVVLAGECIHPVEAGFLASCVKGGHLGKWDGPYPFHEIASFMAAAGMDPMANYDRLPDELPKHDPAADVSQSARLLHTAIWKLKNLP